MKAHKNIIGISALSIGALAACSYTGETHRSGGTAAVYEATKTISGKPLAVFEMSGGGKGLEGRLAIVLNDGTRVYLANADCDNTYEHFYHCANIGALAMMEKEKPDGSITLKGVMGSDGVFQIHEVKQGDYNISLKREQK